MAEVRIDPTIDEITAECLRIQATWTTDETLKRLRPDLRPTYSLADGRQQVMSNAAYNVHHEQREALQQVLT